MTAAATPINTSLLKKTAARLAAIQCLYQTKICEWALNPAVLIDRFSKDLERNKDDKEIRYPAPPDKKLLAELITGVCEHYEEIGRLITAHLKPEWKQERMNPLLLSVLEVALYEQVHGKKLKPAVISSEYTKLAAAFFTDKEAGFVNGLLETVALKYG